VRLHVQGVVVGTTLTMQPPLGVTGVQAANDKIKWEDIAGVTTPVIAATTVGAVVPNDVQTIPPGGRPWFVRSGDAEFTPVNGEPRFKVGRAATRAGRVLCRSRARLFVMPAPSCGNPIFLIRIGPGFRIRPSTSGSRPVSCGDRESTSS